MFALVGRKAFCRGGVCGLSLRSAGVVLNLGRDGVGAADEATLLNINSTSLASILSMLLSAIKAIGPGVEMRERVLPKGMRRIGDGEEVGLAFLCRLRVDAWAVGESG